ncbi:MAG: NAD-dependent epimerase/dehydratase family protein [Minisyncoccia bacterium]
MSKPKTILVTGGAGFIGSHLCRRLIRDGHQVISLDNYFAGSKENHVPGVDYREGHTKNIESLVPETPDLIYHLGEYARVEQSLLEPEVVHDLNILGTRAVLDFWKKRGSKLVYAGSSTKFGDEGKTRETTPYASTKAKNSELVKEIGEKEKLPYAITYFYNVFGEGERFGIYGTVIEVFKRMYLAGSPITVVSPGTQRRNFTHVDDIVEGLVLVGEKGAGDEYGLGNEKTCSILEVAQMFGKDIIMLPERAGNRMVSSLDTTKVRALGWATRKNLEDYVREFKERNTKGIMRERRVLVFSTTFLPVAGPAENALEELVKKMPEINFDIVTSCFSPHSRNKVEERNNVVVHRVGFGHKTDKYLLPILGYRRAKKLHNEHKYLFTWSLMASYAALAGVLLKRAAKLPLLITLADHNIAEIPPLFRGALKIILSDADQVYGMGHQEEHAKKLTGKNLRKSLGEGDAFANQIRFVYSDILRRTLDN